MGSKLRSLTRKVITLPGLTHDARQAGSIEPGDVITATIRRVRASDVAARTGIPPSIYRAQLQVSEIDDPKAREQRLTDIMAEDPTALQDSLAMNDQQARQIVHTGTVHISVPGDPDLPVTYEDGDREDAISPSELGDDFATLHDAIVRFSSLPYGTMRSTMPTEDETPAVQEVDGVGAFPSERLGGDIIEDGGDVQHDPLGPST